MSMGHIRFLAAKGIAELLDANVYDDAGDEILEIRQEDDEHDNEVAQKTAKANAGER